MEGSLVAYKVFTNGSVLNASEINDNLMNQSVIVFSNSTARSAALTSPVEGMVTYLEDTSSYESYNGTSWVGFGGGSGVLQVKSTFKSNPYTMSSSTFDDVTDLNVSITPTSATNKVLVTFSLSGQADEAQNGMFVRLMRDSTAIGIADSDGTRTRTTYGNISQPPNAGYMGGFTFLDSPATTSAVVYKVQVASNTNGQGVFVNRLNNNADQTNLSRSASSITVMEVTP
jgi:hypothetical protein